MNDHYLVKEIVLYLYGELGDEESAKLNRHVGKCDKCRLELQRLKETIGRFQQLEMLEPSVSCREAVRRLVREQSGARAPRLSKTRKFLERFIPRMTHPVTVGLGMLIFLVALSLYICREKGLFPFRRGMSQKIVEMEKWGNSIEDSLSFVGAEVKRIKEGKDTLALWVVEEKCFFDETISEVAEKTKMIKWTMQLDERLLLDREIANVGRALFYLSNELDDI